MRFTPEDFKELESVIEIIVARMVNELTQTLQRKVALLQADNNSFRQLLHKGIDE